MGKLITAEEFANLAGVSAGATRRWGRDGFPGAKKVLSEKNRPKWVFDSSIARPYAKTLRKLNDTFRIVGQG